MSLFILNRRRLFISNSCLLLCFWLASAAAFVMADGEVESLKDFVYWPSGKVRACTVYDVSGRLKAKAFCRDDGTIEKIEKFDAGGNKSEEAFYDQKGKLKTGIDGWAARRWWYEDSRVISQITYDEEGRPTERRFYSESGRLILRQYRDSDTLDPYEGAAMAFLLGGRNMPYHDPRVRE